jgi:hypothetical protein
MNSDSARSRARVKVNPDGLRDLLLQIAEILTLRGNTARFTEVVPTRDQPARLLVALNPKYDFFTHQSLPL